MGLSWQRRGVEDGKASWGGGGCRLKASRRQPRPASVYLAAGPRARIQGRRLPRFPGRCGRSIGQRLARLSQRWKLAPGREKTEEARRGGHEASRQRFSSASLLLGTAPRLDAPFGHRRRLACIRWRCRCASWPGRPATPSRRRRPPPPAGFCRPRPGHAGRIIARAPPPLVSPRSSGSRPRLGEQGDRADPGGRRGGEKGLLGSSSLASLAFLPSSSLWLSPPRPLFFAFSSSCRLLSNYAPSGSQLLRPRLRISLFPLAFRPSRSLRCSAAEGRIVAQDAHAPAPPALCRAWPRALLVVRHRDRDPSPPPASGRPGPGKTGPDGWRR